MSTTYEDAAAHPERIEQEVRESVKRCRRVAQQYRERLVELSKAHRPKD
jgi:hypothetical protein